MCGFCVAVVVNLIISEHYVWEGKNKSQVVLTTHFTGVIQPVDQRGVILLPQRVCTSHTPKMVKNSRDEK